MKFRQEEEENLRFIAAEGGRRRGQTPRYPKGLATRRAKRYTTRAQCPLGRLKAQGNVTFAPSLYPNE